MASAAEIQATVDQLVETVGGSQAGPVSGVALVEGICSALDEILTDPDAGVAVADAGVLSGKLRANAQSLVGGIFVGPPVEEPAPAPAPTPEPEPEEEV